MRTFEKIEGMTLQKIITTVSFYYTRSLVCYLWANDKVLITVLWMRKSRQSKALTLQLLIACTGMCIRRTADDQSLSRLFLLTPKQPADDGLILILERHHSAGEVHGDNSWLTALWRISQPAAGARGGRALHTWVPHTSLPSGWIWAVKNKEFPSNPCQEFKIPF